jgi:DNA-binding NtrC family response regulator
VADFCHNCGGSIDVGRSVALGGARVALRLPANGSAPKASQRCALPEDGVDFLVVEDEAAIRIFLQEWLDASGFRVATATSLEQVREVLQSRKIHLKGVLMDWWILGTRPEEILELVRESEPNVPTIAMSGLEVLRGDLDRLRIDRFLQKPFSTSELMETLDRAGIVRDQAREGGLQRGFFEDMSAE